MPVNSLATARADLANWINGQPRPAIVLERTLNGIHNTVHTEIRYWLDTETGLWLKAEPTQYSHVQTRMIVTQFGRR